MADSTFWRTLADQFRALPRQFAMLRAERLSLVGSTEVGNWTLVGMPTHKMQFDTLARRAATEIPNPVSTDLLTAWLEALVKQGDAPFNHEITNTSKSLDGTVTAHVMRILSGLPEHSANYCQMLESAAVQAEFEDKQRNDPKNWTQFRQRIEALESMKEVRNAPPYRISEAVVRNIIADIDGIKPEDVTWKRIAFEIAGLGGPNRRHIEVVPTPPPESPPTPEGEQSGAQSEPGPAKHPQVEKPEVMSVAAETVAAQIEKFRDECRWTNEQLAEAAELSTRQVARHVSGEAMPYKRNIAAYERVFSKKLKKQIVISKKS